jgi:outer membrane lipoprotein-sorting protein
VHGSLTWFFVLLFVCFGAHAENTDLLNTIVTGLGQHSAIRADFTQQRQNPALTQAQISKGQLLFVTGHGMLWQIQQPYRQTLAFTGTRAVSIDAEGRTQTVRGERGVGQIAQMLQGMLTGQLAEVTRQFDVHADGSAAQWNLRFTPKQSRVAQVLRGIQLDGGAYLQRIRVDMQDGTQTDIQMTDTRDAGPLSAQEKRALGLP